MRLPPLVLSEDRPNISPGPPVAVQEAQINNDKLAHASACRVYVVSPTDSQGLL